MKKLLSILTTLALVVMASCQNSEGVGYEIPDNIKITSQDVSFGPQASTGTITVAAPGEITVSHEADEWLSASVSGSTITVSVAENPELTGRSAVLTIKCGGESKNITVQQLGAIFQLNVSNSSVVANDAAKSYSYTYSSNLPFEVTTDAEWIKATVEEGKVSVSLEENATGNPRQGSVYVVMSGGTPQKVVTYTQCDFAKDVAGNYVLVYLDTKDNQWYGFSAIIDSNKNVSLPEVGLQFALSWDESKMEMGVKNAQNMGMYMGYYVHNIAYDAISSYIVWDTQIFQKGVYSMEEEEGEQFHIWEIVDNGVWGEAEANTIVLYAAIGTPFTNENKYAPLAVMTLPYFLKDTSTPAGVSTSAKRTVRGKSIKMITSLDEIKK